MKAIKGDITAIEKGVIISQVNCQNAMGSGLARAIYEKWPVVKTEYHEFCDYYSTEFGNDTDLILLGEIQEIIVQNSPEIIVINAFGQLNFGNSQKTGQRYTDYAALKQCFRSIAANKLAGGYLDSDGTQLPIYIPTLIGAGLGAGDHKIIHRLIEYYLPDAILVDF